jgi:hypothetical protein
MKGLDGTKAAAKLKQQQMTENDPSEKRLQIKKFFFISTWCTTGCSCLTERFIAIGHQGRLC